MLKVRSVYPSRKRVSAVLTPENAAFSMQLGLCLANQITPTASTRAPRDAGTAQSPCCGQAGPKALLVIQQAQKCAKLVGTLKSDSV